MRKSNALLLLAALGGCASSTADPPTNTWDERQERIEQQEEELAQRERAQRLEAQRERAADADRAEPSTESRDPSTVSVNDSSLATSGAQKSPTTAPQSEPSASVDKKADARALVTPLDQGNDKRDLEITQQIRKTVMDDGSLSFNAKNVKIITKNGQVTLRGEVASAKERTSIETAARGVAGSTNVSSQLEVNP